jgi:hypothetical protein
MARGKRGAIDENCGLPEAARDGKRFDRKSAGLPGFRNSICLSQYMVVLSFCERIWEATNGRMGLLQEVRISM